MLVKNSIIISSARLVNRGLGLASTLVVARILVPEDYGIIATCMLIQAFGQIFTKLGVTQNLISSSDISREFVDSLFAQRVLVSFISSCAIFFASPWVSHWFNDPRIEGVLHVISWIFIIDALCNFNIEIEARNNNFKPELVARITGKIFQVAVTVLLAIYLKSYWALAIGMITFAIVNMVSSYFTVRPYRIGKIKLHAIYLNFNYSKWYIGREVVNYCNNRLSQIVIGRIFDKGLLGYFSVGRDLCFMFALEMSAAIDKSNFSFFSKKLLDKSTTRNMSDVIIENIGQIFCLKALVIIPFYTSFIVYPEFFVRLILGDNWLGLIPYFRLFSIAALFVGFNTTFAPLFDTLRMPHVSYRNSLISLGGLVIFSGLAIYFHEPKLFILGTITMALVTIAYYSISLVVLCGVNAVGIFYSVFEVVFLSLFSLGVGVLVKIAGFPTEIALIMYSILFYVFILIWAKASKNKVYLELFESVLVYAKKRLARIKN